LALLLTAPAALAADDAPAMPKPGWTRLAKSLLYYDAEGALSDEIGLGRWEEAGPAGVQVKRIAAGTSENQRFAWTLETRASWNTQKTKLLEDQRILRFFGPAGAELWTDEDADFIADSEPLVFSRNGEVCLVAARRNTGWYAVARSYIGNTLWETGPFPQLETLQISPNGRYATVRWNEPEQSATHSFLDIRGQARQDMASSEFLLGLARVDDEGRAFADKKLVFSFPPKAAAPPASGATP